MPDAPGALPASAPRPVPSGAAPTAAPTAPPQKVNDMSDIQFFGHVIDGEEVESLDGARFDVYNPWTREVWAQAAEASAADAARAVASARKAFDEGPWPRLGRVERAALIHRLADLMDERSDELATLDTTNMGKPFAQAKHDVGRSVAN